MILLEAWRYLAAHPQAFLTALGSERAYKSARFVILDRR